MRTGIYLLVGPDPDLPERQLAYVGEGDQVRTRLAAHDADDAKDFFTRVVRLVPNGDGFYRFTADTAFDSPSGAGGAVYGGSVNGRRYWKHLDSGQSYGDWRKARLES